jgi:hypothetical protein
MALPGNTLSTSQVYIEFLAPRDIYKVDLEDYEMGGVALSDTSGGLMAKVWHGYMDGDGFYLEAPGVSPTLVFTQPMVQEVSFTFDQSMRPFVTWYQTNGVAKYRWYDTLVSNYVISTLPSGSITPRASLDDKRASQSSASDIILAYVRNSALYYVQQRDRFETERLLESGIGTKKLDRIGMNRGYRFQFKYKP